MELPPFKMIIKTEMERYRAETFWGKEPETIAWINSFADGDIFCDIGANIGVYSLYCAAVHPGCQVKAFEPHEGNFQRLMDNISLNGFCDRITPSRDMIGDDTGQRGFKVASDEVGSSGGQLTEKGNHMCRSIDDLVFYTFSFPTPNHVKIDIDGQEQKVIEGMRRTLRMKELKSVLVEVSAESRQLIGFAMGMAGFTSENGFNNMSPHSSERRRAEGIDAENIVFTRR